MPKGPAPTTRYEPRGNTEVNPAAPCRCREAGRYCPRHGTYGVPLTTPATPRVVGRQGRGRRCLRAPGGG